MASKEKYTYPFFNLSTNLKSSCSADGSIYFLLIVSVIMPYIFTTLYGEFYQQKSCIWEITQLIWSVWILTPQNSTTALYHALCQFTFTFTFNELVYNNIYKLKFKGENGGFDFIHIYKYLISLISWSKHRKRSCIIIIYERQLNKVDRRSLYQIILRISENSVYF